MVPNKIVYKFNYFLLQTNDEDNILDLFKSTNLPNSKTETGFASLLEINHTEKYITGIMGLIYDQNLPGKYNLTNRQRGPLDLNTDEGVVYGSAFLYDIERNVFVYQGTRPGVSPLGCIGYLAEHNKVTVDPIVILDVNLMQKNLAGKDISNMEIKLSNSGTHLFSKDMSAKELSKAAEKFGAATLDVKFSADRGKSLTRKSVIKFIKEVMSDRDTYKNQIKSLHLTYKDGEGKSQLVDLISHKMTFDLDYLRGRNNISTLLREDFLKQVIDKYEENLPRLIQNLNLQKT
ncbi:MAG: hypothetical protein LCH52_05605 [Bacteroidetes bacterium]|nr:hypothetical protein [Bacteroidota bacterium]